VRQHERRALQPLDDVRHHERLARAGGAERCLIAVALVKPARDPVDRLG
jgi:hypothetical protein